MDKLKMENTNTEHWKRTSLSIPLKNVCRHVYWQAPSYREGDIRNCCQLKIRYFWIVKRTRKKIKQNHVQHLMEEINLKLKSIWFKFIKSSKVLLQLYGSFWSHSAFHQGIKRTAMGTSSTKFKSALPILFCFCRTIHAWPLFI